MKGFDESSKDHVSIEVEQVRLSTSESSRQKVQKVDNQSKVSDYEHDRINVWPMIGKLITVGISEQGKTRAENVMMTQRSRCRKSLKVCCENMTCLKKIRIIFDH